MSDSEDESSDSSCDFLVPAEKINLNSRFFQENLVSKSNLKTPANAIKDLDSDSEEELEDFKAEDIDNVQSAQLFSQILSNLEKEKNLEDQRKRELVSQGDKNNDSKLESSKSKGLTSEISQLLLQGETGAASSSHDRHSEEDDEEKEEKPETSSEYTIPKEGVLITLPGSSLMLERKKKKTDLETLLRNKLNQRIRTTQVLVHKVGLLWWLVYGFLLNRIANDPETLAICLSLISKNDYPKGRVDLVYLQRVTTWFSKSFPMAAKKEERILTTASLLERIAERKVYNYRELVLLFIALLRAIGLNCRLVVNLCPPPLKPKREQLIPPKKEETAAGKAEETGEKSRNAKNTKNTKNVKNSKTQEKKSEKSKSTSKKSGKSEESEKPIFDNSPEGRKIAQTKARKKAAAILKKEKEEETKNPSKENSKNAPKTEKETKSVSKTRKNVPKEPVVIMESDSDEDIIITKRSDETEKSVKSRITQKNRKLISPDEKTDEKKKTAENVPESKKEKAKTPLAKRLRTRLQKEPLEIIESDSDEDFIPTEKINRQARSKIPQKNRKLISSDEEQVQKDTRDIWVEVYIESEKSWIPVSVPSAKINCIKEIYKNAMEPVLYIVAYNSEGKVKDVTRRYCPNWMTVTRKQRVDENWWAESLRPWKEQDSAISKAEDEMLLKRELEQPLPKTMTECKGHPLYALARHLLKFEALYPPDAVPLGYLKNGEGIYSRYCVHTLRSRETWIKHARVVKPAQEAYKIVKSMPKYDKFSGQKIKDLPLELFGKWQTTAYVPPEAKDGKVPRNEYGNVDLFKMSMLPKGTVHIDLPGLNRVAKKLNIDCVPAVVGFNFSGIGSHPAFEGYVVCEEFEDTLRDAWEDEQVQAAKRATEKREKRIYGNWRKLIKGLLIRVRLAAKYSTNQNEESDDSDHERVAIIRSQLQAKRKSKSEEAQKGGKIIKKLKLTQNDDAGKKAATKKETKLNKAKVNEEAATTSKPQKRKVSRKRIVVEDDDDDEEEESEPDFEVNVPKRETRSLRSLKLPKQIIDDDDDEDQENVKKDDAEFEIEKPVKEIKSQSSKPVKRSSSERKRIDEDDGEKSISDTEAKKPKNETKKPLRSLKLPTQSEDSDFELEQPEKVIKTHKRI